MYYTSHYVFHEHNTKRIIGHTEERDDLYHLKKFNNQGKSTKSIVLSFLPKLLKAIKKGYIFKKIHFVHSSFVILKTIFYYSKN